MMNHLGDSLYARGDDPDSDPCTRQRMLRKDLRRDNVKHDSLTVVSRSLNSLTESDIKDLHHGLYLVPSKRFIEKKTKNSSSEQDSGPTSLHRTRAE